MSQNFGTTEFGVGKTHMSYPPECSSMHQLFLVTFTYEQGKELAIKKPLSTDTPFTCNKVTSQVAIVIFA